MQKNLMISIYSSLPLMKDIVKGNEQIREMSNKTKTLLYNSGNNTVIAK